VQHALISIELGEPDQFDRATDGVHWPYCYHSTRLRNVPY
jgi:hypothetical protein